jgi:HAD superfamily hydrolase (TIGR01509 family)
MSKGDLDLQAVIFDQDGLMLDTEPAAYRGWRDALAEEGHILTQEQYGKVVGRSSQSVRRVMMDFYGEDIPIDALIERKNALIEADFEANGILPKAGIFELLGVVEEHGLLKAVATSTPVEYVVQKMNSAGICDDFDAIVGGDEVGRGKPAPDIYLLAARRLGASPGRCLVLEDSEAGVRAASAAGMAVIMVPDVIAPSPEVEALAHKVMPSLSAVAEYLDWELGAGGI